MFYDNVNRAYLVAVDNNGNFYANGCHYCGWLKNHHGLSMACNKAGNVTGRYVAPSNAIRIVRMKTNRKKNK